MWMLKKHKIIERIWNLSSQEIKILTEYVAIRTYEVIDKKK